MATTCPQCGIPVGDHIHSCALGVVSSAAGRTPLSSTDVRRSGTALAPNLAGALAYVFGFVSGIAFLVLEPYRRDSYVRFHAFQSIFFSLAWFVFWIPWNILTSTLLHAVLFTAARPLVALAIGAVSLLIGLGAFACWVFLMYKAYSNERFEIPLIGRPAATQAGHVVA